LLKTFGYDFRYPIKKCCLMRKIDILNFITDFRKAPNDVKTYTQVLSHLGAAQEQMITQMLTELQEARIIRQTELNGERAFQVIAR
jgi:DNA-binding HxlR family transcriptional regulator